MNHTEELREELLTILCGLCDPPDQDGFGDTHFIERRENVISEILSLLHKKNYQKVRSRPIMIAGEAAGNKDGPAMLKAVQIMVKEGYKYCEPIDIGGTNEDK